MKQITLEILSVGQPKHVPVPGKAGYYTIEVAYKDNGKVGGKKFVSFKEPQVFENLKTFVMGDQVSVSMEKELGTDEREYWVWKEVTKVEGATNSTQPVSSPVNQTQETPTPASQTSTGVKATGKVLGSNYETPAERARKQVFIVRQSSIDQARQFLNGPELPSLEDVLYVASKIEDYVFNGYQKIYEDGEVEKGSGKSSEVGQKTNPLGTDQESPVVTSKPRRGRPPKALQEHQAPTEPPDEDIPF